MFLSPYDTYLIFNSMTEFKFIKFIHKIYSFIQFIFYLYIYTSFYLGPHYLLK